MNIYLPEALKSFVDAQVSEGSFGTSSEYVLELIRKEQDRLYLHGSFANAFPDPRITFVWGLFPRDAVLGVETQMPATGGVESLSARRYTDDVIGDRERILQMAIAARHEHRPDEVPFTLDAAPAPPLDEAGRRAALRGYARGTIFI